MIAHTWCVFSFAAIAMAANSQPPRPLADVPLLKGTVQPVVAATVNGHPDTHCIIDTGSSIGVIGRAISRTSSNKGVSPVRVANGREMMQKVEVNEIKIGAVSSRHIDFVQRDANVLDPSAPAPCVLGNNVWQRFTLDLDGHANRLRLFANGTAIDDILGGPVAAGTHLDPTFQDTPILKTDIVIGDVHAAAGIDTGWSYASANIALLDALGLHDGDRRIYTRLVAPLDSTREKAIRLADVSPFRIGALRVETIAIDVGSANESLIKSVNGPYLHVGWQALREHRLLMDFSRQDLAIVP